MCGGSAAVHEKQVAYSTLSVTFYSRSIAVETGKGFGYQVMGALRQGWDFMLDLVFALISIWPLIIALLAGFFLLRRWRRSRKPVKPAAS
ncbi:DUF4349 domain-containing protein [Pedobacter sp. HMF7056]|uniref:DUF4349 domain-containing protein n=1 Tax=Hufsiella ginkgonis TaxID=2695274 RepID=A0A7K1Y470_9SPHI|nr:DUF4349 domain-containing protein [Hufsiella ginkgonis]